MAKDEIEKQLICKISDYTELNTLFDGLCENDKHCKELLKELQSIAKETEKTINELNAKVWAPIEKFLQSKNLSKKKDSLFVDEGSIFRKTIEPVIGVVQ